MIWPRGIYVATKSLGVYYTNNFTDPAIQTKWTAVNTGLANVGCREMKVDPFDAENKQYVLTESDRILYRRDNQGSWASILTPAAVDTLLSTSACTIHGFCTDPSTPGRLWALVGSAGINAPPNGYWAIYSDNYGATWIAPTKIVSGYATYWAGTVRANGDNVWVEASYGLGNASRIYYSYDKGSTWSNYFISLGGYYAGIQHNSLAPGRIYFTVIFEKIIKRLDAGVVTVTNGYSNYGNTFLWFDADDIDHQRAIYNDNHLLVTTDGWDTYTDITPLSFNVLGIAPYSGPGDQMLVGLKLGTYQHHAVGAMAGSTTTVTGIAGPMPGTSPYTDSIPNTSGGACIDGVQGVRAMGRVYTHAVAMPGYAGADRGTPLPGDRAAWDTANYPAVHANDLDTASGIHHTLGTGENQAASGKTVDDHIADTNNPHQVSKVDVGLGNVENILDNLSAATAPSTGDDSGDGYAVGSKWIDTTNDKAYVCLDASLGAAVWQEVGAGGGGGDAADITFTPTVPADWDADIDPGNVDDALDQLAERVEDIENAGGSGSDASVITYTPAVAADWNGGADPGNADDALDQVAERVKDLEDAGSGGGDVIGPSVAVDGHLAVFDGTTGKLIKDGGLISLSNYWGINKPSINDFSFINQGIAKAYEDNLGIHIYSDPLSGGNWRIMEKNIPSAPFTITMGFLLSILAVNYTIVGLTIRDSSSGKLIVLQIGETVEKIQLQKWSSVTSFFGNYLTVNAATSHFIKWLRVVDDGTNFNFYYSGDGCYYILLKSVSRTDYLLSPDKIGFGLSIYNGIYGGGLTLLSWTEN
jgi:hypothetical protein